MLFTYEKITLLSYICIYLFFYTIGNVKYLNKLNENLERGFPKVVIYNVLKG